MPSCRTPRAGALIQQETARVEASGRHGLNSTTKYAVAALVAGLALAGATAGCATREIPFAELRQTYGLPASRTFEPSPGVRVHYTGRLKDGTVFDSSVARGKPSDFAVDRLITGWSAAMLTLKPGGKAVIYIPPHLGYGGIRSGNIPPFSGLIFEVEVIAVNPGPAK